MMKVFILASIVIIQAAVCMSDGHSDDICGGKTDGAMHPDPNNCNIFYLCLGGIPYYITCPKGLLFNTRYNVCDWPANVNCPQKITQSFGSDTTVQTSETTSTTTTTTTPTTSTSTLLTSTSTLLTSTLRSTSSSRSTLSDNTTALVKVVQPTNPPSKTFCSSKANDLYADPDRCGSFYQCHNFVTYSMTCQQNLFFNPKCKCCDWKKNVNCSMLTENPHINEPISSKVDNNLTYSVAPPNLTNISADACGKVVCYVPNWAVYRQGFGASFGPDNVNPDLCTHIIYAFAKVEGNSLVAFEAGDEPQWGDIGNFAKITNLKLRNPKLKIILGVGGWTMGASAFSNMAATEYSRAEFINSAIHFMRNRNFDGIDLDWEYPNSGENSAERFTLLCEEFRAAMDKENSGDRRLLLTGAVSAGKYTIDTSYNVPRISAAFDMMHVMTYDLHGNWDGKTGHHSPLKAGSWESTEESYLNVEWAANYWASLGAPKHKIAIGIPLYARTFTLQSTSQTEVGAPTSGPGLPGKYTGENGFLSYYEVCSIRNQSTQYNIHDQKVPYLVSGDQWVGFDNPASIKEKVRFILEQGFGGIMVWELSSDDFTGRFCEEGPYPLVSAILSQCALFRKN